MGVSAAPDIFQEKMYSLMEGLEYVRCYLDDLLVLSNGSFIDHLEKNRCRNVTSTSSWLKVQSEKMSLRNAGT